MKQLLSAIVFTCLSAASWAGPAYSVAATTIGELMKNPDAKEILVKHLPKTTANEQFAMAEGFTLEFIAGFDQTGELTPETLGAIDKELSALAAQ